jgi:hypothetical protein
MVVLSLPSFTPVFGDSVNDLLKYVPEGANSIAVLRVRDLVDSPRGRQENWAEKHASEHLDGAVTVPPWAELLVRASHVRLGMPGGDWAAVILPLPDEFEMSRFAESVETELQEIGGHPAVFSPVRNGYFLELKEPDNRPRVLVGKAPVTRQEVARWLASIPADGPGPLSEYLTSAVRDESPQVILAIDLHEMLDPVQIRYRLAGAEVLENRPQARSALTLNFQSLRGIRLAVTVRETAVAQIRMDFGRQIGDEGQYVKPLLIEFLSDAGAHLDELEDASVQVRGTSVTLQMPISDESLRRILSLITTPPAPASPAVEPAPETPSPDEPRRRVDVTASLRYFRAVNRNIDDLQRAYGRAREYTRTAQWHENFARRIDSLPTAGVDAELVQYGEQISSYFRALAASLRGTGVKVDALDRSVVYEVHRRPVYRSGIEWWWGPAWSTTGPAFEVKVESNLQEVRAQQAGIVAAASNEREQIWEMINTARSETRQSMAMKYGEDFR